MARLRKPSPNERSIFVPPQETRATRSSPRKTSREPRYTSSTEEEGFFLVPKSSRREPQHAPDAEGSFLLPKTIATAGVLTPRKQRILRPVESNSRLFRKLSHESLASPEKRQREKREGRGTMDTDVGKRSGLMYARNLAKSVVKKQASKGRINVVREAEANEAAHRPRSKGGEQRKEEVLDLVADEEVETSLWCGDEDDAAQNRGGAELEETSDDEDDEPVVRIRDRQRQPRVRRIPSDSESEESGASLERPMTRNPQPSFKIPERKQEQVSAKEEAQPLASMRPPFRKGHSTISNWAQDVIDLTDSPEPPASFIVAPPTRVRGTSFTASSRPTSSASNGALAILTYSPTPTKNRSPHKAPPISRPSTPPLAPPSPSKLKSPSKKKPTIPNAPHLDGRPSLDAFWDPELVNEWNERHSPIKPLVSPRKQKWREDIVKMMEGVALEDSGDEGYESPTISPKKTTVRSPTKKNIAGTNEGELSVKDLRAQRKSFAARKHAIAESFLVELDNTICSGRIASLSETAGGIKLIWSKTLKTTAGRANWRREQFRVRTGPLPMDTRIETRHHCSIELAEKVIDDEERLYNVLAHEFCHLATFMISEVRNNPHGAEFKTWGRRVTDVFQHKGVEVTTKHSYKIEYKYIWECIECGYEFKRHSKSVDPARHSCGRCKGRLAQTKPTPRNGASATTTLDKNGNMVAKEKSEYQVFVKANFSRVQQELVKAGADAQMGRVMEALGRQYREMKAGKEKLAASGVNEMELALGELRI